MAKKYMSPCGFPTFTAPRSSTRSSSACPYASSRRQYISWASDSFFGIEQGSSQTAFVDRYDFGLAGFNSDEVRARLSEMNLKFADKTSKESFKFYDQDGFQVQVNAPDYIGHVS